MPAPAVGASPRRRCRPHRRAFPGVRRRRGNGRELQVALQRDRRHGRARAVPGMRAPSVSHRTGAVGSGARRPRPGRSRRRGRPRSMPAHRATRSAAVGPGAEVLLNDRLGGARLTGISSMASSAGPSAFRSSRCASLGERQRARQVPAATPARRSRRAPRWAVPGPMPDRFSAVFERSPPPSCRWRGNTTAASPRSTRNLSAAGVTSISARSAPPSPGSRFQRDEHSWTW